MDGRSEKFLDSLIRTWIRRIEEKEAELRRKLISAPEKERERLRKKLDALERRKESLRKILVSKREEPDEFRAFRTKFKRLAKEIMTGTYERVYLARYPLEDYSEVEGYEIESGYAAVKILKHKVKKQYLYFVSEPILSVQEKEQLEELKKIVERYLAISPKNVESRRRYVGQVFDSIVSEYPLEVDRRSLGKLRYYLVRDYGGYGPIDVMMRDPWVEDISCDGVGVPIYVYHRKYGSVRTNVSFRTERDLDNFVMKLAVLCGKQISVAEPLLDATLPDGSRLQATFRKEVTTRGSTFTIRRFREIPFSPVELIENGTATPEVMAYLWLLVEYGRSGVFFGGTAAGKTTLLNAVAMFIPPNEKIVSIEDTREINLPHENWIPSVARERAAERGKEVSMYELLKAALRQRPKYIIVGEVRGREAYVMFQAMATGHATYSTFHAESPMALVHRFTQEPINVPKPLFSTLDFLVHIKPVRDPETRLIQRKIVEVVEILDYLPSREEILMNLSFSYDPREKTLKRGALKVLDEISEATGISTRDLTRDLEARKKVLEWALKKGYTRFSDFSSVVFQYYENPEDLLAEVEAE